jgi:hypothetical protein
MSNEVPTAAFDVVIHDRYQYVYRVAFFGELSEDWLCEWKTMFYDISDMEGHAAHLAEILHRDALLTFAEGYGNITWFEKGWKRVSIWTARGDEIAFAVVKRIDAAQPTKKYDYVTVGVAGWEGFDVRIDR